MKLAGDLVNDQAGRKQDIYIYIYNFFSYKTENNQKLCFKITSYFSGNKYNNAWFSKSG